MEGWLIRTLIAAGFCLIVGLCAVPDLSAQAGGILLVANKGEHTLGIIDPVQGQMVAKVDEGGITGHEVAASPDGRLAFVPLYGNSGVGMAGTDGQTIAVIDIAARKLVNTIDLGKPLRPHCAVFGPQNGLLYVTTELGNAITIIDPESQKVMALPSSVVT